MKAFYRVEIVPSENEADRNGTYQDVKFTDGYAYVDWRVLGEHETEVAIQALGHDSRFQVTPILESDLPQEAPKKEKAPGEKTPGKKTILK
jgi:hypothetical protein